MLEPLKNILSLEIYGKSKWILISKDIHNIITLSFKINPMLENMPGYKMYFFFTKNNRKISKT